MIKKGERNDGLRNYLRKSMDLTINAAGNSLLNLNTTNENGVNNSQL
jgi:hypothetical protein